MEYWVVTEDTLDIVAEKTGRPRSFFEREMTSINNCDANMVVFFDGEWKQISISMAYSVDFVMKHHFNAEEGSVMEKPKTVPVHLGTGGPVVGKAYATTENGKVTVHLEMDHSKAHYLFTQELNDSLLGDLSMDGGTP